MPVYEIGCQHCKAVRIGTCELPSGMEPHAALLGYYCDDCALKLAAAEARIGVARLRNMDDKDYEKELNRATPDEIALYTQMRGR